jgi:DNA-directed RNA polymerase specialized sigma24 family protein
MAQPLTKMDGNGDRYRRPAEIEAAIDTAVAQDLKQLRARASPRSCASAGGLLPSEVLVHLVRAARRKGDQAALGAFFTQLLARCESILRRRVPDGDLPNAEEVREEILQHFAVLLAEDSPQLDYFECKFNRAFRALRAQHVRPARRTARRIEDVPETHASDDPEAESTEGDVLARLSETYRSQPTQLDDVRRGEIAGAINSLPEDQRKAVVLVYLYGMKEESDDPNERTAAKECSVSGRTIRNRLGQARAALARILKEDS